MASSTATSDTPTAGTRNPVFTDAMRWIVEAEGGAKLVNDTGGLTKWGISQRSHPHVDIANLTREGAEDIYHEAYWRPIKANALPPALALVVFDAAVNMGVPTAVKILQTVLRSVKVDGVAGPETVAAAKMYLPRPELVAQFLRLRSSWYRDLAATSPKYGKYLYGWELRCFRLALEAGRWRGL